MDSVACGVPLSGEAGIRMSGREQEKRVHVSITMFGAKSDNLELMCLFTRLSHCRHSWPLSLAVPVPSERLPLSCHFTAAPFVIAPRSTGCSAKPQECRTLVDRFATWMNYVRHTVVELHSESF